MMKGSS